MDIEKQERLIKLMNEYVNYDYEEGIAVWKKRASGRALIGASVGCQRYKGTQRWIQIKGIQTNLSTALYISYHGKTISPNMTVGFLDWDISNIKIENLFVQFLHQHPKKCCTKLYSNNKTGIKGVIRTSYTKVNGEVKVRYIAQIHLNKATKRLGNFDDPIKAGQCYDAYVDKFINRSGIVRKMTNKMLGLL